MLKIFARSLFRNSRALRVELEKSVQKWGILIGPSCQLTHPSFMALGDCEHSWLLPGLSVHSLLTRACILPDLWLCHFGPRFKGLQMCLAGYSWFIPLTMLMVRADFGRTFCMSNWFVLRFMLKEQKEDEGAAWWPLREAQMSSMSSTHCQRWQDWFTKCVNFHVDYHYGNQRGDSWEICGLCRDGW